jgi:transcriptional regulator with XRE-family HTH domain
VSALDTNELVRLRLQASLSHRALGDRLGVSAGVIARLEQGFGHNRLTLDRLARLASALGTTPAALLARPDETALPGSDDIKVEAAIAGSSTLLSPEELARGLNWTLARTHRALRQLRGRLKSTGLDLHRTQNGYSLIHRDAALSTVERRRLASARIGRRGIRLAEARVLRLALFGRLNTAWEQHARAYERIALGSMLKAGYLCRVGKDYRVSDAILGELVRGGHPPRPLQTHKTARDDV